MKYTDKHIATATNLITFYKGATPLSNYLKQYFTTNKKYGSKDRKQIAHFCFLYYRVVNATKAVSINEIITIALFICEDTIEDYINLFKPEWLINWRDTKVERISFIQSIYPDFNEAIIFPLVNELSKGIDNRAFCNAHLTQPDLFLRIRPHKKVTVIKKLDTSGISYSVINNCLVLPNNSKIDDILQIDKEVVVQDYSSQRIAEFLVSIQSAIINKTTTFSVWDCCAASGGKSILLIDVMDNVTLTVSDIRKSIIQNLIARFARAGITQYKSFIADVSNSKFQILNSKFDIIICDAPCSGSGTWGRTPEQLYFFKKIDIEKYTKLQKKIVTNTLPKLAADGYFLYITCSVFKQENEAMVAFIQQQNPFLQLVNQTLLIGYTKKADTMFAALFYLPKK